MEDIRSFVVHNNYLTYFVINEESLYVLFCFFESSSHCYLLHGFEFVSINLSFFFVTYKHVIQLGEESCLHLILSCPQTPEHVSGYILYIIDDATPRLIAVDFVFPFTNVWLLVVDMFDFLNIFVSHILPPIHKNGVLPHLIYIKKLSSLLICLCLIHP